MSYLVLQIIIKQWDKSQRSDQDQQRRALIPNQYPLTNAHYLFKKQVILDQYGDDLLGDRVSCNLNDDQHVTIDRFQVSLTNKTLKYVGKPDSNTTPRLIGSLDSNWIQCKYNWRYRVYEGGFYYWLYEEIILNAICVESLSEDVFIKQKPALSITDLAME